MQNPEISPYKVQVKLFAEDYDKSNAASFGEPRLGINLNLFLLKL